MRPTGGTYVLGFVVLVTMTLVYLVSFGVPSNPTGRIGLTAVALLAMAGAVHALRTSLPIHRPRLVDVIAAVIGTVLTLVLVRALGIPSLVAVGAVLAGVGVAAMAGGPLDDRSSRAGYAGTFVGLIAPSVTVPWAWVVAAAALTGITWSVVAPAVFSGVGGRIGVSAFIGSLPLYWLAEAIGAVGSVDALPPAAGPPHWAVVPVAVASVLVNTMLFRASGNYTLTIGLTSLVVCGGIALADMAVGGVVLSAAWFGAAAICATSPSRLPSVAWLALAGVIFGALIVRMDGPLTNHVGVVGVVSDVGALTALGVLLAVRRLSRQARVA